MPLDDTSAYGKSAEKPFDLILSLNKKHKAIELKSHTKHTAWSLNKVEPHQVEGLQRAQNNGYGAYIIVNVRFGLGKQRVNFARVFSLREYKKLVRRSEKGGRKSITLSEMQAGHCITGQQLPRRGLETRRKRFIWNLNRFVVQD